jgi:hypothetical protein
LFFALFTVPLPSEDGKYPKTEEENASYQFRRTEQHHQPLHG